MATTTLKAVPPSVNGWNAEYLQSVYEQYKADASSVPADMQSFFAGFDLAIASGSGVASSGGGGDNREALRLFAGTRALIDAYRRFGHFGAKIDPFGRARPRDKSLELSAHGLTQADMDKAVDAGDFPLKGATLRQLIDALEQVYCGPVGVQYMHIADHTQREWLRNKIESSRFRLPLGKQERVRIYEQIFRAEAFEQFLQKRYMGEKRFGIEGGESLLAIYHRIMQASADTGCEEIIIGMSHRGRLDVLNGILGKSYKQIVTEFEGTWPSNYAGSGGDVKYHMGYSGEYKTDSGKTVQASMAFNPSHLEVVAPVACGRVRAKQRLRGDTDNRHKVIPVIQHGDAALIGQGVGPELLNMSQLEGYTNGGTIHIVANNMIGFTTTPQDGRSCTYCTDAGLMVDVPAFHVRAADPEACVAVTQIAVEYRQQFKRDVFIDMYCFRKWGHNEQDEQSFTQPVLAQLIKDQKSLVTEYAERLVSEGVLTPNQMAALQETLDREHEAAENDAKKKPGPTTKEPGGWRWKGFGGEWSFSPVETAVSKELLAEVCAAFGRLPDGFELNPKLKALMQSRASLLQNGALNHADAEMLAFGTLLLEGNAVRLSGQDCRRGTYTQRHAVLRDFKTGEAFNPLNSMRPVASKPDDAGKKNESGKLTQARLCVYDSPLSEEAVIGFDYGYSLADPSMLVCWEAQFGDFVNGAQVMIDQFISSTELKWRRWSGFTMLLPHGAEGMGPEHSSCRPERFLTGSAHDNWQVCYPSTGAQMFHLLRRQVSKERKFRKPLIVLTPKSWLRRATSNINELLSGTFQEFLDDSAFIQSNGTPPKGDRKNVKTVMLCSGKVYHELSDHRELTKKYDTALVRVEQFYPFHKELAKKILAQYPAKAKLVWFQEEPRNNGAYLFLEDIFRNELGLTLEFIGRPASPTPSGGSKHLHAHEQGDLLAQALGPAPKAAESAAKAKA
jgi:2-oxoglutarate dehydrogenase E1 component